jgi:hypothetical protein
MNWRRPLSSLAPLSVAAAQTEAGDRRQKLEELRDVTAPGT